MPRVFPAVPNYQVFTVSMSYNQSTTRNIMTEKKEKRKEGQKRQKRHKVTSAAMVMCGGESHDPAIIGFYLSR